MPYTKPTVYGIPNLQYTVHQTYSIRYTKPTVYGIPNLQYTVYGTFMVRCLLDALPWGGGGI